MASTTMQKAAAKAAAKKAAPTMQDYIRSMLPGIKAALPSVITPERFTRIAMSAVSSDSKLAQCTPQSFLGALMTAAQLGLEPNTPLGQAYLIPYYNSRKGAYEAQFQLGYKGLIDLVRRSGEVSVIQAQVVYENDEFAYSYGLEPTLRHVPALGDRGPAKHVYGLFKTKDGGYGYEVMSMDDVRAFASRYSKAGSSGPWRTNFEEMAKKTVLKRVLKYAPIRSEVMREIVQDETVKSEIAPDMYDIPNTFAVSDIPEESSEPAREAPAPAPADEGEAADLAEMAGELS